MLITHGRLIIEDQGSILSDAAVWISNGLIAEVGTTAELRARHPDADTLDARGQWIMPGGINAHTHFYGTFARGMAVPGQPPADFPAILRQLWWNLDRALDAEAIRLSALLSLIDAIRSGTTTLFDHHASPNAIEGSLDIIAGAVRQAGVRAALCYEVTDRNGFAGMEAGIAENVRFLHSLDPADQQVRGLFGLHASLTLSDRALRRAVEANTFGVGFHIHVAEHEADQINSLAKSGMRVVPRLERFGILNERGIAAHCVHVDADERAALRRLNPWITHQARSNMNNGVGAMPFDTMMNEGLRVCLGSDGFFGSIWEEMKAAYFMHKLVNRDPRAANGGHVAGAAARNAALAGQVFGGTFGQVAVGAHADLILIDYQPFTPLSGGNLPWHILFGMDSSMVTTTIANGTLLMRDRILMTLDERSITEAAYAIAPSVWRRCAEIAEQK
jgi:putative selenium metabolism protein SsnA